jgi:pimeloyl-ACP methyl ester carboxylesterase
MFRAWNDIWLSPEFRNWNIESFLDAVDCPVLLLQGEDDEYGTERQVEAVVERISGPIQSVMLPGCGHSPHRDRPDVVRRLMLRFIAEVKTEGRRQKAEVRGTK